MDAAVSRKKFDREVAFFDGASENAIDLPGWGEMKVVWPELSLVFTHSKSGRPVGFRFLFDNWDQSPPSLSLFDPTTGAELPWERWPQGGWSVGNPHPSTGRPFLCLPGIREYHTHSSHLNDPWENYRVRDSYKLAHLLHRVWQRFEATNG